MSTDVSLEVHGMCIVKEASGADAHSTVISVDRGIAARGLRSGEQIPPLITHLIFSRAALAGMSGNLPAFRIASADYSRINNTMFTMALSPRTTVVFSQPARSLFPTCGIFPPITVANLGLGTLRNGYGTGAFQPMEGARLHLPARAASSGWGEFLGVYTFPSNSNPLEPHHAADMFFWTASYSDHCRITLVDEKEAEIGFLELTGAAEVRFACYADREEDDDAQLRNAFDFHELLAQICTGGPFQKPERMSRVGYHAGSPSCPPVKNDPGTGG
jgi:hypothetical protein